MLSPAEQQVLNEKITLAQEHTLVWQGKLASAVYQQHWQAFLQKHHLKANKNQGAATAVTPNGCPNIAADGVTPASCYVTHTLNVTQKPQDTSYYCGPASVQEILYYYGDYYSQETLAGSSYLNTDNNKSTNWSDGAGHSVVAQTLNTVINNGSIYYAAVPVSSMSESTYVAYMTTDIDGGYPVDSGIQEVHNGNLLPGHPNPLPGHTIQHWITIRGYTSSGSNTEIADSAAGASSLGWTGAQAYSTQTSLVMYDLFSPYGIVW